MHNHALHRRLLVACDCCRIKEYFEFKSHTDLIICERCIGHQGDSPARIKQRAYDHEKYLLAKWKEEKAERLEQVTALTEQVDGLLDVLENRFDSDHDYSESFWAWLGDELAERAEREKEAAYRSKDHVMSVLMQINDLHRARPGSERCSCGKVKCREFQALERVQPSLGKWLEEQERRSRRGQRNFIDELSPVRRTRSIPAIFRGSW
ncbi:hypothetical protein ACFYTQ_26435 [Nocardia sp. NPDC004068]|uniref:hypothetical protein n=1 Tax=Nocardia sp. NPDC004068 TaxID=3364303 RepID=UPI0036AAE384